jgi:hypothetical protein
MASRAMKVEPKTVATPGPSVQRVRSKAVDEAEIASLAYRLWEAGRPTDSPEWIGLREKRN